MMKDEGPFVLEWIAHHLAVGFTDIVVYTNDCSDGTDTMLMRLEDLGLAYHRVNRIPEGLRPQPSAINYAQDEELVGDSDWVMVFDADEFLCIKYGDGTLDDLLTAVKARGANGIVVTWRIFGSGGIQDWSRAPVTEQYLLAAPTDWNKGWGVKTLFQFDPTYWKLGIHRPKMKNKWLESDFPDSVKWLNGSGLPMEDYFKFRGWRSIVRTLGYDWVQMNHYAVKSIDSYAIRKFRGNVNFKKDKYNADYWSLQDRNEVRDDAMLRYSKERQRIFDALLTDPVLHDLHFAALERAEARLAEFKQTEDYAALVAGLRAASTVPITDVEAKPPQARDPAKIAKLMSRVEKAVTEKQKAERVAEKPVRGVGVYADEPLADVPETVPWYANHKIDLPLDSRLFTATGLSLIREGKFERSLARNLPRLLSKSVRHVELGGGCGFLSALLAKARPELRQAVYEAHPLWHREIERVWQANALRSGANLRLIGAGMAADACALSIFLTTEAPTSLAIGDPSVGPAALADMFLDGKCSAPDLVYLTGRAAEAYAANPVPFDRFFETLGLTRRLPYDFVAVAKPDARAKRKAAGKTPTA
ncbi:MAG: glycosyltransferase family 2 protein [Rhodobacteraceae bacterium]|nr:glycosyltransferase family 2 protein [Paracoccaceae bacterium]